MGDEHGHDDDEKECIDCQVPLILADVDYEWPGFGAICYGCLLKRYKAAPAPLVWPSERPKVVGYYWSRPRGSDSEYYTGIDRINDRQINDPNWGLGWEFAGPIPEPREKESGA